MRYTTITFTASITDPRTGEDLDVQVTAEIEPYVPATHLDPPEGGGCFLSVVSIVDGYDFTAQDELTPAVMEELERQAREDADAREEYNRERSYAGRHDDDRI